MYLRFVGYAARSTHHTPPPLRVQVRVGGGGSAETAGRLKPRRSPAFFLQSRCLGEGNNFVIFIPMYIYLSYLGFVSLKYFIKRLLGF